jgi:hypothetical protein
VLIIWDDGLHQVIASVKELKENGFVWGFDNAYDKAIFENPKTNFL